MCVWESESGGGRVLGVLNGFRLSFVLCKKGDGSRQTGYCIFNEEGIPPTPHPILLRISPHRDNLNVWREPAVRKVICHFFSHSLCILEVGWPRVYLSLGLIWGRPLKHRWWGNPCGVNQRSGGGVWFKSFRGFVLKDFLSTGAVRFGWFTV